MAAFGTRTCSPARRGCCRQPDHLPPVRSAATRCELPLAWPCRPRAGRSTLRELPMFFRGSIGVSLPAENWQAMLGRRKSPIAPLPAGRSCAVPGQSRLGPAGTDSVRCPRPAAPGLSSFVDQPSRRPGLRAYFQERSEKMRVVSDAGRERSWHGHPRPKHPDQARHGPARPGWPAFVRQGAVVDCTRRRKWAAPPKITSEGR